MTEMSLIDPKKLKLRAKWRRAYWKNRDKKLTRCADYRAKNLDKVRKSRIDWQRKNWAYRQEYMRKYYASKREGIKAASKSNYAANRKARLETNKKWRARNPDKVKQFYKNYYPKGLITNQKWRDRNRGKWTALSSRRRALQRKATINLNQITEWMQSVRSKESVVCYYCKTFIPANKVHFDHIIALIKGGSHSVDNLCVSCPKCNLSKGAKELQKWIKHGQLLLRI
jgi:5-methylcytosine-specific restriction endonuclease McrA